jgi:signal transduction histidine kinase
MRSRNDSGRRERRLRWLLGLLFVGLTLPATLLIRQGFAQIELAEFRRQQLIAESLVRGVDARLAAAIAVENARPVTDFDYAVTTTGGAGSVVQLSPLSSLAAAGTFPGTIGYFQVDATGELSTPLLPESDRDTVPAAERVAKMSVETELASVLEANRLLRAGGPPLGEERQEQAAPAQFRATVRDSADERVREDEELARRDDRRGQAAFDELAGLGDAALDASAEEPEPVTVTGSRTAPESVASVPVSTFAGDLEPLRFGLLETGHFVLFRNAWRDGERFVQGLLIDRASFIDETLERVLAGSGLAAGTVTTVSTSGRPVASLSAGGTVGNGRVDGSALYETRLSPPLAEIEMEFASGVLGQGPGFSLLVWTSLTLFGVLVGGFVAMYRFGVQQMRLAQQQQNFVSAVSHELKTPLTSIRMYGEMLKSGWADDARKQVYYDYIFDEGERLSRLIDNVLQLARLNNGGPALAIEPIAVGELLDVLRSRLSSQAERAGFSLELRAEPDVADTVISADVDALIQVFINLVDNAIKFSADAATKEIQIGARRRDRASVVFAVRDFGPGIPPPEMKRLFELFYRPDNELTRTTAGTGIGLALVRQLITAMAGRVDVKNQDPGAEFRIVLPTA